MVQRKRGLEKQVVIVLVFIALCLIPTGVMATRAVYVGGVGDAGVLGNTSLDAALHYAKPTGDTIILVGNTVATRTKGNITSFSDFISDASAQAWSTPYKSINITSNGFHILLNNTLMFPGNVTQGGVGVVGDLIISFDDNPYFEYSTTDPQVHNNTLIQFAGNGTTINGMMTGGTIACGAFNSHAINITSFNNTINLNGWTITGNPDIAINHTVESRNNNIIINTSTTINATKKGIDLFGLNNNIWVNSQVISAAQGKVYIENQARNNWIYDLGFANPNVYLYNGSVSKNVSAWYFYNNTWSKSQNTCPRIWVGPNIPLAGNVSITAYFANATSVDLPLTTNKTVNVLSNTSLQDIDNGYTKGIIFNDTSLVVFRGMPAQVPVNLTYGENYFGKQYGEKNQGYYLGSVFVLNFDPILSLPEGNNFNHTQMTNWTTIADYTAAPNLTFAVDNGAAAPLMLGMLKFNNNLDLTNQTVGTALSLIGDNFRTAANGDLINFTMINAAMLATFNNQASVTVYPTAFTFNSGNDLQIVGSTDAGAGTTLYSNGAWVNRGGYVGPTDDITIVTDASARKNITLPVLHFSTYAFSKYSAPSPNSPGGGGDTSGAGPSAPAAPAAPAAPGESVTASVNVGGGTAVTKADVTGTGLSNMVVTSQPVSALPSSVSAPSTTVYQTLDITVARTTTISQAVLGFAVSKSWLAEKGYGKQDIAMLHNVGSTWQSLPTVITGEDANNVYYSSTTTTFSYFAIGYQKGAANVTVTATPTATAVATTALPKTTTPPVSTTKAPVATATTVAPAPAASPAGGLPLTTIAIGVVAVIIVAGAVFFVRRWWIQRQNPALFKELK